MITRHTCLALSLVAATLVGGLAPRAEAAAIVIAPTDDDRGIDGLLDGNFLCCQLDSGVATITLNMSFEERVALEFALGAIPSDATITSATLTLFSFSVPLPAAPNTADVHGYAGEGTITAADLIVANLLTSFQVNAAGAIDIPLDPGFIQDLVIAHEGFAGFMLRNVTNPSGVISIYTIDSIAPQFDPTLTIEYEVVPEPSSLLLIATALALAGPRLRRGPPVHHP